MSRILVVEDSPTQAVQVEMMLADADYETESAADGVEALKAIERRPPDLVLTDLHMPNMNGLELVEAVRQQYERIPVILMTADGTETIAVEALQKGAASYIPKRLLERILHSTLSDIFGVMRKERSREHVSRSLVECNARFVFGHDPEIVTGMVQRFEEELRGMQYLDETGLLRITLALREALVNAVDHGNLELDSALRDDRPGEYAQMGADRRTQSPYQERQVTLTAQIVPEQVTFVIRDEGPGFDPSKIPDPTDPENLIRAHGRGLMLIQNFMDEVRHNETGNEITLIKRREPLKSVAA
ncbi:ATP-binding response regulator [Alienimonas chondri]|uniref:Sensor histidine kinase RcsC n=1 Tax=Alienimonas chondri TaxID=2681879 RepID=A0ABX1VCP8_9PLAN|nr:response regulator [Alienimonas chondri]NNJ25007.1 Sensor histidine kinase RcsC [Alienimonas chondri]